MGGWPSKLNTFVVAAKAAIIIKFQFELDRSSPFGSHFWRSSFDWFAILENGNVKPRHH